MPDPQLKVLDEIEISSELELVSELFHRINRIIPENQKLLNLEPKATVREAFSRMRQNGYSQIPIVDNGEVLGVFSYRSFAQASASLKLEAIAQQKCAPGDLPVEEFIESFQYARVTSEMPDVFGAMERDNGVLIGSPDKLQGILTPMDFLHYLYKLASPFVFISEIELALRALINLSVDPIELKQCALRSLGQLYGPDKVPRTLEEMTFDNYKAIIENRLNWPKFEPFFGNNRTRIISKLKEIGELRNIVFHFKREISLEETEVLSGHRNWLLLKARQADVRRRQEIDDE